ncbi:MAG: FAD-binding oxidoreductase, partial [Bdellovibrionales bacterium]|nr:FAD-binding oxidoreductase [Bdellovibrionales bacterium]
GGTLVETSSLDHILHFDTQTGILVAEAGLSIFALLKFAVPQGWFVPVTPGTQFVTLGGAIANDVHGKNHHRAGTFGRHVVSLELARSNGEVVRCSLSENHELFQATVAGLGLTGCILTVSLQLIPISSSRITMESIQFFSLDEFFEIAESSDRDFDYTVAWLDCMNPVQSAGGNSELGRGVFMRGRHKTGPGTIGSSLDAGRGPGILQVPFDFPGWALNSLSLKAFNTAYFHKQLRREKIADVHYRPFFYPLDSVLHWNRIYGKRGFLQFQCVVPRTPENSPIRTLLQRVSRYGKASFLAVIKQFGGIESPGMLSFPRPGITLCLDFPFDGQRTINLFRELEEDVREFGGALYPAKDACMSGESFRAFYPRWREFSEFIDPHFSSSFWRRVIG